MVPPTSVGVRVSDSTGGSGEAPPSQPHPYPPSGPSAQNTRSSEPTQALKKEQPFPTDLGIFRSPKGHTLQVKRGATYFGTCRPVDRFKNISRVGEGTYGVVYKVLDKDADSDLPKRVPPGIVSSGKGRRRSRSTQEGVCALKRIRMDQEKDGLPLSTMREITMLRRIRHENVVSLDEVVVGAQPNEFFMVMEYCAQDLGTLLDHMPNPYTRAEVKCLTLQLLRGLEHCHRMGIIHRDLKMSNLLLTSHGILKIADFGLARLLPKEMEGRLSPKVVTLWYRAPELLFGQENYDFSIDLW